MMAFKSCEKLNSIFADLEELVQTLAKICSVALLHIWKLFQMLGGRVGLSLEAGLLTSPLGETPHLISLQFN